MFNPVKAKSEGEIYAIWNRGAVEMFKNMFKKLNAEKRKRTMGGSIIALETIVKSCDIERVGRRFPFLLSASELKHSRD